MLALVSEDLPTLLCVYERVPVASIPLVCSSLAPSLLPRLLFFLHTVLSTDVAVGTRHLQIHLLWLSCVLKLHMHVFQGNSCDLLPYTTILHAYRTLPNRR